MRTDRDRQAEALADFDLLPDDQTDGASGLLIQTFTETTYPTVAQSVYACVAVLVDAADTEGATPAFTAGSDTFYALNIGTEIPPSGSYVIASGVGGRLVFSWDKAP